MIPKLVTFDCAGTIVEVAADWSIGRFAVKCALHVGLETTTQDAALYDSLYQSRLPEFAEVNMAQDSERQERFWTRLAADWLVATSRPARWLEPLRQAAEELGFGPNSVAFRLYDDVIPCLDRLDAAGIKAAVVSNWDYSLHRVLAMFGLAGRFVTAVASLEEGVEKPDPKLFEITLARAGFCAGDALHVGDDPVDDVAGAEGAGLHALRIDRSLIATRRPVLASLTDLAGAFDWIA